MLGFQRSCATLRADFSPWFKVFKALEPDYIVSRAGVVGRCAVGRDDENHSEQHEAAKQHA